MKHLVLALGMLAIPKQEKSLLSPPSPLTPYIQTSIEVEDKEKIIQIKPNKTTPLVKALMAVESNYNESAFNEKENAVGCLQIRPIMVREVNRILRKQKSKIRYTKGDRWDCGKSEEMFYIWCNYHHKVSTDEIIARNWNGGPRGYKKQSTEHYWQKVQKAQKLWEN